MTGRLRLLQRPVIYRWLALAGLALVVVAFQAHAATRTSAGPGIITKTVNTTANDASDGVCNGTPNTVDAVDATHDCTLREAIELANSGGADIIKFSIAGTGPHIINLDPDSSAGDLPNITVDALTIDASGESIVLDGEDGGGGSWASQAIYVEASGNSWDFTIKAGTGTLTIRDIDGTAVEVCGREECSPYNVSVDNIIVDDLDIAATIDANGVRVRANNMTGVQVTNNRIHTGGNGVLLESYGDRNVGGQPEDLHDNTVNVTGNTITSDFGYGAAVELCAFLGGGPDVCVLSSTLLVNVNNNTAITAFDDGVRVIINDIQSATSGSTITAHVDNNGDVTGDRGAVIDIYVCCDPSSDVTALGTVNDNDDIVGSDGNAVDTYVNLCCGSGGNTSTSQVNGNASISGDGNGVQTNVVAANGDGDAAHATVNDNGNITGSSGLGVWVIGTAGDLTNSGGASDNAVTVDVNGNGSISGSSSQGVMIDSNAGTEVDGTATGNSSTVNVNDNVDVSSVQEDGIRVLSNAGNRTCCNVNTANDNTSTVHVDGNGNIVGASDSATYRANGVKVRARSGVEAYGQADYNTSTISVSGNGDITAHGESYDQAVDADARAGVGTDDNTTGDGAGDNNAATITIDGNGKLHGLAGDGSGEGGDGIEADAESGVDGAYGTGDGDGNVSTIIVTNNDEITSSSDQGADLTTESGGSTSDSQNNHNTVTVTGNGQMIGNDSSSGLWITSHACCDPDNTNDVTVSNNTGDIRSDSGGQAPGLQIDFGTYVILFMTEASHNTVHVENNAGTFTGSGSDGGGIHINSPSNTDNTTAATINHNTAANSGGDGIRLCCGDWTASTVSNNTVNNNTETGIMLGFAYSFGFGQDINGVTVGPNNIVRNNGTEDFCCTGIEVAGSGHGNTITRNSTYDNTGLGIDLYDSSGGPDEVGCTGPDTPNDCVPFPTIVTFQSGKLTGTACANCLVEVFVADDAPADQDDSDGDPHGEGKTYVASGSADGSGDFSIMLSCGVSAGNLLTATATDANGSTSEFAENFGPLISGSPSCTPTITPTFTPTRTHTPTRTPTGTPPTSTPTLTVTGTPPATATETATPTSTPTVTNTPVPPTNTPVPPTATRTPTPVAKPCGDVNDDGQVNSVDAALILQLEAGLITSLPNMPSADVNNDEHVNSVDAALILQKEAGLLTSLNC